MIKPIWYLDDQTLVTILKVIKLNRDLKEKILQIIVDEIYREEFPMEFILFDYSEYEMDYLDTSDYYLSD